MDGDTGVVLGAGELGEITFRIPNLMRGYHNRTDATAEVLDKQRWFRSGWCIVVGLCVCVATKEGSCHLDASACLK